MDFKITKAEDACILRSFLRENLCLSAHTVSLLKAKENGILLNGEPVTVRAVLKEGDLLSLRMEDTESNENLLPCDLPLSILLEDGDMVVCNKSGDMPTHPSMKHYTDTLANALAYRYRHTPFVFRAITRLDLETSGAVLCGRTAFSAQRLSLQMQKGEIQKAYFALLHGVIAEKGEISFPIRRKEGSVLLRETHPNGAPALTRFRRIYTDGRYSLVAVFPKTGRTHQIRLHFSLLGHPLCADYLYGREDDGFPRTMLHAARLAFIHPVTDKPMSVFAPLPPDFVTALRSISFPIPTEADAVEG